MPKYYFYGVRKAQILYTRLRMGCSSLNLDHFMKNITDSPMCQCGSTENTQHFVFHCNFYQRQRTILLNSCNLHVPYSYAQSFTKWWSTPSKAINEDIFTHVHQYILDFKRFYFESMFSTRPKCHDRSRDVAIFLIPFPQSCYFVIQCPKLVPFCILNLFFFAFYFFFFFFFFFSFFFFFVFFFLFFSH